MNRNMQIVRFDNGYHGIRKTVGFFRKSFMFLDLDSGANVIWRERKNKYFKDCQGSLQVTERHYNRIVASGSNVDMGTPININN